VKINAVEIDKILQKYGYSFKFDMLHNETELEKYEKTEKNFDRVKYLTIFTKEGIVVGRLYPRNSLVYKDEDLSKIDLNEEEIDKIIAFFTFFKIPHNKDIINDITELAGVDTKNIKVELITNNVYKRDIDQSKDY